MGLEDTITGTITPRVLRLFTIRGDKEWVLALTDEFHEGIKNEMEGMYKKRGGG